MSDAAPEKSTKKIYRSRNDRLLGGVLAGIAESQGWDITFTRMVYIILPCGIGAAGLVVKRVLTIW